jgi:hypothetical protein
MEIHGLNAPEAPLPAAAYTQAIEVSNAMRTLYIKRAGRPEERWNDP